MSDTPRTDAVVREHQYAGKDGAYWYISGCNALSAYARMLERELQSLQVKCDAFNMVLSGVSAKAGIDTPALMELLKKAESRILNPTTP
jgi:hypothetical protein